MSRIPQYTYSITRYYNSRVDGVRYEHLDIEFKNADEYLTSRTILTLNWIRVEDSTEEWSAFEMSIGNISYVRDMETATKLARRVVPDEGRWNLRPADVIELLDKKRFIRSVYDGRINRHVPINDVLPIDHYTWTTDNSESRYLDVVANNEFSAQIELDRQLLESYGGKTVHKNWVAADRPVKEVLDWRGGRQVGPTIISTEDLLATIPQ